MTPPLASDKSKRSLMLRILDLVTKYGNRFKLVSSKARKKLWFAITPNG